MIIFHLNCDGRETVTDRMWKVCRERAYAADTVRRGDEGRRLPRWGCQENYLAVLFGIAGDRQRAMIFQRLKTEDLCSFFVPDPKDYDAIIPGIDGNHMVAIALNRYRWPDDKMAPVGTPYFTGFALQALLELGMVMKKSLARKANSVGKQAIIDSAHFLLFIYS